MALSEFDYSKVKLLVVEDEAHTRAIIRSLLRQMGVRALEEASNGRDALVKATDWRPHLILCDIHMKPVNGFEFLQLLRKVENTIVAHTPVVLLTGDAKRDSVMIAKEHEVSGYLVKPVSLSTLKSRLDPIVEALKL